MAMSRAQRILAWGAFSLAMLVGSGLLLADRFTPRAAGVPSHTLSLQAGATEIDRELAPLLAANPGRTGTLLLTDGLDAFAARAMSARRAGRSLDLQYYIWHDDITGRLLAREAHAAAERGVRVRILLDDINAVGKDTGLLALDAHPDIEVRVYNPFRNRDGIARLLEMVQRLFSLNHRMHNKAWIADGRVAVVGGRNIGIEYFNASDESNFHDLDLLLFGPAVAQASAIFDDFWNSAAAVPLAALANAGDDDVAAVAAASTEEAATPAARRYLQRVEASPNVRAYVAQRLTPHWTGDLLIASDPPLKGRGDDRSGWLVHRIEDSLLSARAKALVISPYFVPGEDRTADLVGLARRGVHVGVVTNSLAANDVVAVHGGYARYREALLRGGVKLYEIRAQGRADASAMGSSGASLHTKAFLVDDRRGFIGSYNLDPRSANLNTEMGVFFDHPGIAADLNREYLHLAGPALSYWTWLGDDGELRWLDAAQPPPRVLDREPEAGAWRRFQALVFRWLPIESQL